MLQTRPHTFGFPGCWGINPTELTEAMKENVLNQISHTIKCLIESNQYENIVFRWEVCGESILNELLSKLDPTTYVSKILKFD